MKSCHSREVPPYTTWFHAPAAYNCLLPVYVSFSPSPSPSTSPPSRSHQSTRVWSGWVCFTATSTCLVASCGACAVPTAPTRLTSGRKFSRWYARTHKHTHMFFLKNTCFSGTVALCSVGSTGSRWYLSRYKQTHMHARSQWLLFAWQVQWNSRGDTWNCTQHLFTTLR